MTEDEMVGWHHQLNGHEFSYIGLLATNSIPFHLYEKKKNLHFENCFPWKENSRFNRVFSVPFSTSKMLLKSLLICLVANEKSV